MDEPVNLSDSTSPDPTFQTKGSLTISLLSNFIGWGSTIQVPGQPYFNFLSYINLIADPIVYGPPSAPPQPWVAGTQFTTQDGKCFLAGTTFPSPDASGVSGQPYGVYCPTQVNDMSPSAVITGKSYALITEIKGLGIQLYTRVTGVANGSIVTAGFGLHGLSNNPKGYTYITPPVFTGEFQIGLHSPFSQTVIWLSVEYAPPKDYFGDKKMNARLNFKLDGAVYSGGVSFYDPEESVQQQHAGTCELHAKSHPYQIISLA